MGWTQTLELAHTLTKAIQANVKPDAAVSQQTTEEATMGDTSNGSAIIDQAPAPAHPPAPAGEDQAAKNVSSDINTTLKNTAALAQALHEKPEVLSFMQALLGQVGTAVK